MNYVSSVAERAIHSLSRLIDQAMTYAWTSTLEHRCPGSEFALRLWLLQAESEDNLGGGDFCAPEADALTGNDLPLE